MLSRRKIGPSDIIQDNINKEIVKLLLTHWLADHTIEETTKRIVVKLGTKASYQVLENY